ncbi:MAG TPA: DUF6504 family protein [Opitutaceae bacterium]|nr:DUF6504 family protein [Opitutaceae bacterium]
MRPPAGNPERAAPPPHPAEEFIGAAIKPEDGLYALADMAAGEPGLPLAFTWDKRRYEVLEVLEKWKGTGDCHHGSGERYVRKHWFRVRTTGGLEMKLYFERQARGGKHRWWLNTVRRSGADPAASSEFAGR